MMSTIAISQELKEKIRSLGKVGDSYEDVIRKMYDFCAKEFLKIYLYDMSDAIPIDEAIKLLNKRKKEQ